jgi:hypothetical protein
MAESTGTFVAYVYRTGRSRVVYLDHSGDHRMLNVAENMCAGSEWDEALVYHEQEPPMPPKETGLYRLELPWRDAVAPTAEEKADPDYDSGDDETQDGEICCVFTESPKWTMVFDPSACRGATTEEPTR